MSYQANHGLPGRWYPVVLCRKVLVFGVLQTEQVTEFYEQLKKWKKKASIVLMQFFVWRNLQGYSKKKKKSLQFILFSIGVVVVVGGGSINNRE